MDVLLTVKHISVSIKRSPAEVYAFAGNPENLPSWAKGLSGSIKRVDGDWVADSPMGPVKVRFVANNDLGVLDHEVILPSGERVTNPMRVMANGGGGSELVFTLFRGPDMSDAAWIADAEAVERDLHALKALLEARPRS